MVKERTARGAADQVDWKGHTHGESIQRVESSVVIFLKKKPNKIGFQGRTLSLSLSLSLSLCLLTKRTSGRLCCCNSLSSEGGRIRVSSHRQKDRLADDRQGSKGKRKRNRKMSG